MLRTTRKIVRIDEDKCDGCGLCVPSCAEGAIRIIDGKARLLAENLCDGLGNCLGECPRDAITIEERAADAFDESAVEEHLTAAPKPTAAKAPAGGCPGTMLRKLREAVDGPAAPSAPAGPSAPAAHASSAQDGRGNPTDAVGGLGRSAPRSKLGHWPVQLKLLPERGPLWDNADVLLAADCVAFALPDFHERLLEGKTLAIACPKLDDGDAYVDKLARILGANAVRSVTIARMEVPCCGGLVRILQDAIEQAGVTVPLTIVTVTADGRIADVNGVRVG